MGPKTIKFGPGPAQKANKINQQTIKFNQQQSKSSPRGDKPARLGRDRARAQALGPRLIAPGDPGSSETKIAVGGLNKSWRPRPPRTLGQMDRWTDASVFLISASGICPSVRAP